MWYDKLLSLVPAAIALIALIISVRNRNKDNSKEDMKELTDKIDKKADREYVEKEIEEIKADVKSKASGEAMIQLFERIKTMDDRIIKIYQVLIERK